MFLKLNSAIVAMAMPLASAAYAEPMAYTFDTSHSQIVFSYQHLGFSTTSGMFSGVNGTIIFNDVNPADSSVTAEFPIATLLTGDRSRDQHFLSKDFFGKDGSASTASFRSTSIEITGAKNARIRGDLTLNGVMKAVVLDTVMNQRGQHPVANKPWIGFSATTKVKRSDFGLGMYVPVVSDDVEIQISVEASSK